MQCRRPNATPQRNAGVTAVWLSDEHVSVVTEGTCQIDIYQQLAASCRFAGSPERPHRVLGEQGLVACSNAFGRLVLTTLDRPDEVASYLDLYEHLRAAALSPNDSLDLLASLAEQMHTDRR